MHIEAASTSKESSHGVMSSMYEVVGKTMVASFLMPRLAVGLIGISNNPDNQLTEIEITEGISKPAGAKTTEKVSSHGKNDLSKELHKTQVRIQRTQGQA